MGRVTKPHGLTGEVVVALTSTETSRMSAGSVFESDHGPLRIRSVRPHQDKWIVTFDDVEGRDAAEDLRGVVLMAEPLDDDPDALWVHELIGAELVDASGRALGRVTSVEANPASDLLVLDGGGLVPLRFAVGWRDRPRVLEVDVPAGLLDEVD